MAIEKIKILGALLELPAKQHCQSSPFTSKLGQIGQIGSGGFHLYLFPFDFILSTPPRIDLLCMKNWGTQWTMEISSNE